MLLLLKCSFLKAPTILELWPSLTDRGSRAFFCQNETVSHHAVRAALYPLWSAGQGHRHCLSSHGVTGFVALKEVARSCVPRAQCHMTGSYG